jgi:diguanylate cyclase (GGDEF)-like protein
MFLLLGTCAVLIAESALTTYVATRAWTYRPARLFVLLVCALVLMQVGSLIRLHSSDSQIAYAGATLTVLGLCAFDGMLLLFFSALFVPQWWEGSRPIYRILLPYSLVFILLSIDLLGRFGLFVAGLRLVDGLIRIAPARVGGPLLLLIFSASWLVHVAILVVAFVRNRDARLAIGLLALCIVLGAVVGLMSANSTFILQLSGMVQTIPFLATLAYTVIRTRLVEPTRAALNLALEAMSEVVVVLDPAGCVIYANPRAVQLGFYPGQSFLDALRAAGVSAEDSIQLTEQRTLATTQTAGQTLTISTTSYLFEVTFTPVIDAKAHFQGSLMLGRDISELERRNRLLDYERTRLVEAVRKLSYLAGHDSLTNLPNRRSLEVELYRVIARARRGRTSALLFLDLDNFKLVNDTLGHAAGDTLLIELTAKLSKQLRPSDLIARLGGDEFAVILEGTSLDQAHVIAERMRVAVEAFRFTMNGHSFELSLSIGLVAINGQHDAHVLLAQADIAMYSAKEQGRNRIVTYHPKDDSFERLSEANQWVTRIKDALREDQLVLHFQPVRRLNDAHIEHYEVLVRMIGPLGELIPPAAFIPAAERFGLMPQLDRWIVQRTVRTLQEHPTVQLFVNLSGRSLVDETLVEFIETQLEERGVEPARLGFELTESVAIQDMERAESWIKRIKALGCRFVMDDFGVGFASFAYLRSLPIDQIKIDGSFIRMIDRDPSSRAIVQAMHTLAQALGKVTVAEFVEHAAIVEVLREIGIAYGQGYYLSHPSPDLPAPEPTLLGAEGELSDLSVELTPERPYSLVRAERSER